MADGLNIDLIVPRAEEITDFYQAADRMGFHALWFTDRVFSEDWIVNRGLDSFGALPAAAAATSHIRLGTTQLVISPSPSILSFAADLANIDQLSGGRITLGVSPHGWPGGGVGDGPRPRIGGRLIETITLLKRLWSEAEVSFKGNHNNLEKASIDVRPVQAGGIPILVAGVTGAAVHLAATMADGWVHPYGGIPGGAARGCAMVRRLVSLAGRDPDSLDLGKLIYISIDDDKDRARERIATRFRSLYRGFNVDDWCAFGPPTECAAFINRFLDAGITTVMLCLVPADVENLERLHREVVPLLK